MDSYNNIVDAISMPNTIIGIAEAISKMTDGLDVLCAMEKQSPRPADGARSTATFFEHYGHLRAILTLLEIPHVLIPPKKWQKYYNMSKKGTESRDAWKSRLKALATEMYPKSKPTLKTCDAILIASYYRKNF